MADLEMEKHFNAEEVCPESRVLLHHSTVKSVRCGRCGLLNPNLNSQPKPKLIVLEDSQQNPTPAPPPTKRRAVAKSLATIIPTVPNFKLGYAEKERQNADQRILDRKNKIGYIAPIATVHFSVRIAHFTWDHLMENSGFWTAASNQWSVDEENREISSDGLLTSALSKIYHLTKRANLKKWLHPDGDGQWSLGHTNPQKQVSRDIVTWDEKRLLSTMIDAGSYEQKVVTGNPASLSLYGCIGLQKSRLPLPRPPFPRPPLPRPPLPRPPRVTVNSVSYNSKL